MRSLGIAPILLFLMTSPLSLEAQESNSPKVSVQVVSDAQLAPHRSDLVAQGVPQEVIDRYPTCESLGEPWRLASAAGWANLLQIINYFAGPYYLLTSLIGTISGHSGNNRVLGRCASEGITLELIRQAERQSIRLASNLSDHAVFSGVLGILLGGYFGTVAAVGRTAWLGVGGLAVFTTLSIALIGYGIGAIVFGVNQANLFRQRRLALEAWTKPSELGSDAAASSPDPKVTVSLAPYASPRMAGLGLALRF